MKKLIKTFDKYSYFYLLLSCIVIALPINTCAQAKDRSSEIDEIFSWASLDMPGCAVAVSLNGDVVVNRTYGSADLERNIPITPETVFDVGSVQKQFIAAAVFLFIEEGRLSLSDDIHEYIPELPDYGYTITIDHLLTHTSGIRDWTALANLSRRDEDIMTLILRQRGLNFAPGEEWSYSTSGYELLKRIVTRISGMSFSEFAQARLFEPLGMTATSYRDDMRGVIENRALAYEKEGGHWKLAMMHLGVDRGRGAIFSTARDLLIWNEALASGRLSESVTKKIHEPARLNNGRKLKYARGLFLATNYGGRVVWHSGSAAGYKSVLSRYPEQGLSIAILCNAGEAAGGRVGFAASIFDLFVSGTRTSEREAEGSADIEGLDLSGKAGLFISEEDAGEHLRLIVEDARLRIVGGPAVEPVAKHRFRRLGNSLGFMSQDEFELHFLSQDRFELISMEGKITHYRRTEPYNLTPAELQAFAGRYKSNELRSLLEIFPGKEGVMIRLNSNDSQTIEFLPVDPDTFMRGRMMVRFRRDESGNVVALEYSNPVLKNIKYARASENTNRP